MNLDQTAPKGAKEQSHLGTYCLQYRLANHISRQEKLLTKVMTGMSFYYKGLNIYRINILLSGFFSDMCKLW